MSKRNATSLGPGDACDRIAALRESATDQARVAVEKVIEVLTAKEQAIRARVPADRLQSFDHMLKSLALPALLPDLDIDGSTVAPGFGVDPSDSKALLELREQIDKSLPWPSEAARENGEYVLAVMHAGNLLRKEAPPSEIPELNGVHGAGGIATAEMKEAPAKPKGKA